MIVSLNGDRYQCSVCGQVIKTKRLPIVCCTSQTVTQLANQILAKSPGYHLHTLIAKYFGERATLTCGCGAKIDEMNQLGPAGVRERIDEYAAWIGEQADRQKWWDQQPDGKRLRWWKFLSGLPGRSQAIKMMVSHACRIAEKEIVKNLETYFDRVVVVNLKRRADRMEQFNAEIAKGWPFKTPEVFEAIDGDRLPLPERWNQGGGAFGCLQSHRQILERAIADGVDRLLVLEDDLILCDGFAKKVREFLLKVPGNWDGLMIGGQHAGGKEPLDVRPGVVRCLNGQRTHAYAVRGGFMRELYRIWTEGQTEANGHADWLMGPRHPHWHVYAPDPFLAGQRRDKSDINGRENPTKFWVSPPADQPFLLLHCPKAILSELRAKGIHTGYQRDPATDIDTGLVAWKNAPVGEQGALLRKWIEMIQWEVASEPAMIGAIWHPNCTAAMVGTATEWPWHEIMGETVAEVLAALPQEIQARIGQ